MTLPGPTPHLQGPTWPSPICSRAERLPYITPYRPSVFISPCMCEYRNDRWPALRELMVSQCYSIKLDHHLPFQSSNATSVILSFIIPEILHMYHKIMPLEISAFSSSVLLLPANTPAHKPAMHRRPTDSHQGAAYCMFISFDCSK